MHFHTLKLSKIPLSAPLLTTLRSLPVSCIWEFYNRNDQKICLLFDLVWKTKSHYILTSEVVLLLVGLQVTEK